MTPLWVWAALALAAPELEPVTGPEEAARLSLELRTLAQKGAWTGVERTWRALLATGEAPQARDAMIAASAAEAAGDLSLCRARLVSAKDAPDAPLDQLDPWIRRIDETYARVVFVAERASLVALEQPFGTVERAAVARAVAAIEADGRFEGLLPPGPYLLGGVRIDARPGMILDIDVSARRARRTLKQVLQLEGEVASDP